ncbi:MAG: hypothetical protein FJY29_04225 [Betaproteobacteria bacterium]|nr:hypothetical protein [Betaproteobacteria bacterium]
MALTLFNRRLRVFVRWLGLLCVAPAAAARAELGDFFVHQRVGVTESRGSLAREHQRAALQTTLSQSFRTFPTGIPVDIANELSVYLDSFTTRGKDSLYFPLRPQTLARVIEPAFGLDVCFFSMSLVRFCLAGGLSMLHLQTGAEDFQRYVGLPTTARIVIVPFESIFVWELGTRYRKFENRTEGFLNSHEDLFTFVSVGLASIQSR